MFRLKLPGNTSAKVFTRNAVSAYAVQLGGYALVFLTVPYLARTLGADGFGRVAIAISLGSLVGAFIEYGIDVTATRELALFGEVEHGDPRVAQLGANILAVRSLLAVAAALIAAVSHFGFNVLGTDAHAFAWGSVYGLASSCRHTWYFHGLENHYRLNVLSLGGRVVYALGVFALVRTASHVWLVVCLNAVEQWLVSLGTLVQLLRAHGWARPTWGGMRRVISVAHPLFALRIVAWVTSTASPLIVGGIAGAKEAGYYAAGNKLMNALTNLQRPLINVLFPKVSQLAKEQPEAAREWLSRAARYMGAIGAALGIATFVTAPLVAELLFGDGFGPTVTVLRILSVFPFFFGLAQVYGSHGLLANGHIKAQATVLIVGGLLFLPMAVVGIHLLGSAGMATANVLTQALLAVSCMFALRLLRER